MIRFQELIFISSFEYHEYLLLLSENNYFRKGIRLMQNVFEIVGFDNFTMFEDANKHIFISQLRIYAKLIFIVVYFYTCTYIYELK